MVCNQPYLNSLVCAAGKAYFKNAESKADNSRVLFTPLLLGAVNTFYISSYLIFGKEFKLYISAMWFVTELCRVQAFHMLLVIISAISLDLKLEMWLRMFKMARERHYLFIFSK